MAVGKSRSFVGPAGRHARRGGGRYAARELAAKADTRARKGKRREKAGKPACRVSSARLYRESARVRSLRGIAQSRRRPLGTFRSTKDRARSAGSFLGSCGGAERRTGEREFRRVTAAVTRHHYDDTLSARCQPTPREREAALSRTLTLSVSTAQEPR